MSELYREKWEPTIGPYRVLRDPIVTLMPLTQGEYDALKADVLYVLEAGVTDGQERDALTRVGRIVGVDVGGSKPKPLPP